MRTQVPFSQDIVDFHNVVTLFTGNQPCKATSSPTAPPGCSLFLQLSVEGRLLRGAPLNRRRYLISLLIRVWPKIKAFSFNLAIIFFFTLESLSKVKFKELNSLEKDSLIVWEKLVHSEDGCVETPVAFSLIVFVN